MVVPNHLAKKRTRRTITMMSERWLWDRFLFQIRESGLIPEGGKILDVGTGINTTVLEMFGDRWEVTPSDVNVGDWNRHIPGIITVNATHLKSRFDANWDVIIMSEVLEHIPFPQHLDVLRGALYALRPGGILILSVPFMYRIHEYGNDDPETTEPGLKDYGRLTPSGLIDYFNRTDFIEFWVGKLVKEDKKTFPEKDCPEGVVGWARKQEVSSPAMWQRQILEDGWCPDIPSDWREQQTRMAAEYERRRIADAREAVEFV
jgi:SAM-dependent methyltransferase